MTELSWLLLFIPVAITLEFLVPGRHLLIFAASCFAILPLAGWLGRTTEQLAERLGEGVGGLLNATFGNAAELIIALAALRAGLRDVVSIDNRVDCRKYFDVLGASMLAGGLRHTPGDDAHAGGDRVDPAGGLPSRARSQDNRST
jgi:Ca2+:H+ antiporter